MATYKVLQDIEAEDKLLGPLTLKQFIFAIVTIGLVFIAFVFYQINFILALPWLLPISFFGFMAAPIGKDQPNDVWLAARIRFLIKPRVRTWDQDGMQELVTITAPKKVEIQRTDGLSQKEVKSRLSALSNLMDTRGWAIKNVTSMAPVQNVYGHNTPSERLIDLSSFGTTQDVSDVQDRDDMLDPLHNMIAQRIDGAIKQQQEDRIKALKKNMRDGTISQIAEPQAVKTPAAPVQDYSFINQVAENPIPGYGTFGARVVSPGAANSNDELSDATNLVGEEEKNLLDKIHHQKEIQNEIAKSTHEHRINPISKAAPVVQKKPELTTSNAAPDVILKQLGQANDLSVAAIANLAKHAEQDNSLSDNDVISLH